ncbi:MAG: tetratricopeptide repeat protein [Chloroflexota bacterium]
MFKFLWSWALFTWGGLHRYFGHANVMLSEHARAIHYFERAYQVDPSFTAARLHKGVLLSREFGKHEEALAIFEEVLAKEPENSMALLNRALTLQDNGRFPEALTALEAYLALPSRDGHWEEAKRMLRPLQDIVADLQDNEPDSEV